MLGALEVNGSGLEGPLELCRFFQELPPSTAVEVHSQVQEHKTLRPAAGLSLRSTCPCISSLTHPRRVGDRPTVFFTGQMGKLRLGEAQGGVWALVPDFLSLTPNLSCPKPTNAGPWCVLGHERLLCQQL